MNKIWRFEEKEMPFDISETGCMTRLIEALNGLRINLNAFQDSQPADGMLSSHCGILQEFFDDVFGDGSGERICGKLLSAEVYSRAYIQFLDFIKEQLDEMGCMRQAAEERYRARAAMLGLGKETEEERAL